MEVACQAFFQKKIIFLIYHYKSSCFLSFSLVFTPISSFPIHFFAFSDATASTKSAPQTEITVEASKYSNIGRCMYAAVAGAELHSLK